MVGPGLRPPGAPVYPAGGMASAETRTTAREHDLLEAARAGDEDAFGQLLAPYRGELHAHCYRMLGSVHDAEDALQEALAARVARPRALRGAQLAAVVALHDRDEHVPQPDRAAAQARAADRLRPVDRPARRARPAAGRVGLGRALPGRDDSGVEDGLAAPDARYERRESLELAFVAALQLLPATQRAVLILREVLGFSAKEVAATLETTVASVNSALQRARKTIDDKLPERSQQETLRALGDEQLTRDRRRLHGRDAARRRRRGSCRCSPRTPRGRCRRCRPGSAASEEITGFLEFGPLSGDVALAPPARRA